MTHLVPYEDVDVFVLHSTFNPTHIFTIAANLTMRKDNPFQIATELKAERKPITPQKVLKMNHTKLFEHCFISFGISNVSRSLLTQLTTHRIGSITSASQHYQKYDTYPDIMDQDMIDFPGVADVVKSTVTMYNRLIDAGIPKEEARQILTNSKGVNLLWTVNARSLINFFNLRLCLRNVQEMINFASLIYVKCMEWWPELFAYVGPDCKMLGFCRQGSLKAEACKRAGHGEKKS